LVTREKYAVWLNGRGNRKEGCGIGILWKGGDKKLGGKPIERSPEGVQEKSSSTGGPLGGKNWGEKMEDLFLTGRLLFRDGEKMSNSRVGVGGGRVGVETKQHLQETSST